MTRPATTKMTSKGQVVIPEEVRKRLGLKPGIRFLVVGKKDAVILKAIGALFPAARSDLPPLGSVAWAGFAGREDRKGILR